MNLVPRIAACLLFAIALSIAMPSRADLDDGLSALKRGDYATAAKVLQPLAERGDAEAQYRVGLMYEFGKGFEQNAARAACSGWWGRRRTSRWKSWPAM
jgi:TPR repeat protein